MGLRIVTQPAVEPISLAEAKGDLEITHSEDDAMITLLITAARRAVETGTRRSLINRTLELTLDAFPAEILLPRPPVASVTKIEYIDEDGALQLLNSTLYQVDLTGDRVRIIPAYNESWPATRSVLNAVLVTYVAGYGAAADNVPGDLRKAILLLLVHWFENREAVLSGTIVSKVPLSAQWIIDQNLFYGVGAI